jgi:hypothetical protein
MANEATLLIQTEVAIPYTCADGTGIEKGALLKISDPRTVSLSSANYDAIAGIAVNEKIASDGITQIGVIKRGRVKMLLSGSATVGDPVCSLAATGHPNIVGSAKGLVAVSGSSILGVFEETGTNGETITVFLNCGAGGSAA